MQLQSCEKSKPFLFQCLEIGNYNNNWSRSILTNSNTSSKMKYFMFLSIIKALSEKEPNAFAESIDSCHPVQPDMGRNVSLSFSFLLVQV